VANASRPVWAVVGLSSNAERPAFSVARALLDHGRVVIPINPRKEAAHDQRAYASLLDIPQSQRIDVVDLFVASANAGAVADDAIKRGAKAVWFQLGVSDPPVRLTRLAVLQPQILSICYALATLSLVRAPQAAQRCRDAGLLVVEGTCPAIELQRRS
jgi:uncharacterized protein